MGQSLPDVKIFLYGTFSVFLSTDVDTWLLVLTKENTCQNRRGSSAVPQTPLIICLTNRNCVITTYR